MKINLLLEIARGVGLSANDVARIVRTAPQRYKVFPISKRRGIGTRIISQPTRELKLVQRFITKQVLRDLPISSAAFAYRKDLNIGNNATVHLGHSYLLKLDFKNFFPSIVPDDLISRMQHLDWMTPQNSEVLKLTLFRQGVGTSKLCLAIGAPSSPTVSNTVMYEFDEQVLSFARNAGVIYTRYADDLTFSANDHDALMHVESETKRLVDLSASPRLVFNNAKRHLYKRGQKQLVTGLVLTPDAKVSIGRERKRLISAGIHRIKHGFNEEAHVLNIKGWLAFANSVEPDFVRRLERKYGALVNDILHRPVVRKSPPTPPPAPPASPAPKSPSDRQKNSSA